MLPSPSWLLSFDKSQALPGTQGRSPRTCERSWQTVHLLTLEASGVKLRVGGRPGDSSFGNTYAERSLAAFRSLAPRWLASMEP